MSGTKKTQPAFVDLYSILGVAPEAETAELLRRIQHCYSEAQQNLNHTNAQKRLHAQQMFHVYLPQARQVLLQEASREAYNRQRERALMCSGNNENASQVEAARKQEEARIAQEVRSYSINAALDRTFVSALMATTLLFLGDILFTSHGSYPFGIPRLVALGMGITVIAFGLVWHFQLLRQRMQEEARRTPDKNRASILHEQSEQCKRAAFTEAAVLLVGLSLLNALDERYLPIGYPFGSRLVFNGCMALVLTLVFFAGRQCFIHSKQHAKVRNQSAKTRKFSR